MQKQIALTVTGVIVGLGFIAWLQPNDSSGATVVLVICVMLVLAAGAFPWRRSSNLPPANSGPDNAPNLDNVGSSGVALVPDKLCFSLRFIGELRAMPSSRPLWRLHRSWE
jgi:hypothetical protein